jgi:integrase/recombinase XerD
MDFKELVEAFIKHGIYLRDWSPRTVGTYRTALASFTRFQESQRELDSHKAGTLSKAHLDAWIIWMKQSGMETGGVNVYLRTMNSFLTWLHEEGHHPVRLRCKLMRKSEKLLMPFSNADIRVLLAYRPKGFYDLRCWTIINLLVDTGCRIDEILKLRTDGVDLDGLVFTVMGKGSRPRRVPFSPELRKVIFRYMQARQDEIRGGYLFGTRTGLPFSYQNFYRHMRALCKRLKIQGPRVSPHSLRHFFAVSYIRNGGNIYNLSRILGHTSVKTTEIYLRTMGVEDIGAEHGRFSPLARL